MNELIKKEKSKSIVKGEDYNCQNIRYIELLNFVNKYEDRKQKSIQKEIKKLEREQEYFYENEVYPERNGGYIKDFKEQKIELYNLLSRFKGVKNFNQILLDSLPVSFLISTMLMICCFYLFSSASTLAFITFYIGVFSLSSYMNIFFNLTYVNKNKFKKIFKIALSDPNVINFLSKDFDFSTLLKKEDIKTLKSLIHKDDFIITLEKYALNMNYKEVMKYVYYEIEKIEKVIRKTNLNKFYDSI